MIASFKLTEGYVLRGWKAVDDIKGSHHKLEPVLHLIPSVLVRSRGQSVKLPCKPRISTIPDSSTAYTQLAMISILLYQYAIIEDTAIANELLALI
jgi:hypothetical protein